MKCQKFNTPLICAGFGLILSLISLTFKDKQTPYHNLNAPTMAAQAATLALSSLMVQMLRINFITQCQLQLEIN